MTHIKTGTFVTAKLVTGEVRQGWFMGIDPNGHAIVRGTILKYACEPDSMVVVDNPPPQRGSPGYMNK